MNKGTNMHSQVTSTYSCRRRVHGFHLYSPVEYSFSKIVDGGSNQVWKHRVKLPQLRDISVRLLNLNAIAVNLVSKLQADCCVYMYIVKTMTLMWLNIAVWWGLPRDSNAVGQLDLSHGSHWVGSGWVKKIGPTLNSATTTTIQRQQLHSSTSHRNTRHVTTTSCIQLL